MEQKIKELISEMTIEEKIGQLRQCGPSLAGAFDVDFEELVNMVFDGRITKEKFAELMSSANQDYHEEELRNGMIGSYNGISDAATANRLQKIAVEETRLGIPLLFGYDVVHGFRTVTPIPLAESCAWDPWLWKETARISAEEAAAGGVHMTFAPMVDVSKDARWGRISEGAGEDTLLNSVYGAAKVKGFQGENLKDGKSLAACVKHFAAYGAVESGRDYNRVNMSDRRLLEEYLPSYKACLDAGARAVMPAFNDINGIPCTVNEKLLRRLLRDAWKFDGMTVSDSNGIAECVEHGVAENRMDASIKALMAGVDMDMASECYIENLKDAFEKGLISEKVIDQSVANVLRIKMELGLFENPYRTDEIKEKNTMLKPEFREIAKKAAEESMVLLKNDGVLPLKKDTKIAVVGELACLRGEMTGTWSVKAVGEDCVSLVDALELRGITYHYFSEQEILECNDVQKLLSCYEVILTTVGERKSESGEAASKADLSLADIQMDVLKKLKNTDQSIVAILFNGRPMAIPWLDENMAAILEAWHPGVEAGNALVNLLFGDVSPSGKLTVSFPYHSGQCPIYYDHINTGRPAGKSKFTSKYLDTPTEPLYPFGYGLSYTTFEYHGMEVEDEEKQITVNVYVKNTGEISGDEIVQCYFRDVAASCARPVRKLIDFRRISLKPGEEKKVTFMVSREKLGFYNQDMDYVVESGEYQFFVGGNVKECLCESIFLK